MAQRATPVCAADHRLRSPGVGRPRRIGPWSNVGAGARFLSYEAQSRIGRRPLVLWVAKGVAMSFAWRIRVAACALMMPLLVLFTDTAALAAPTSDQPASQP